MAETLQPPVKLSKKALRVSKPKNNDKPNLTVPLSTSIKLKQRLQIALSKLMAEAPIDIPTRKNGVTATSERDTCNKHVDSERNSLVEGIHPPKIMLSSINLNNYQYFLQLKNDVNTIANISSHNKHQQDNSNSPNDCSTSSPSATDIFDISPSTHQFNSNLIDPDTSDVDITGSIIVKK